MRFALKQLQSIAEDELTHLLRYTLPRGLMRDSVFRAYNNRIRAPLIIATEYAETLGWGAIIPYPGHRDKHAKPTIMIYVRAAHRGRGIGTSITKRLQGAANDVHCCVHSSASRALFDKFRLPLSFYSHWQE